MWRDVTHEVTKYVTKTVPVKVENCTVQAIPSQDAQVGSEVVVATGRVPASTGGWELKSTVSASTGEGKIYAVPMKLEGRLVDRLSEAAFVGPCGHVAFAKITNCEPRAGELDEYRVNIVHVFTPETQDTLHYWWFNSRDFGHDDASASKFLLEASTSAYIEDVDALGWITDVLASEPGEFKELSFRADRPGLMMRQILNRMAAAEAV
jgi:hypothetical protein